MGVKNVEKIGSTDMSVGRAAIALVLAIIGTLGLFWVTTELQLVGGNWAFVSEVVAVQFPFRVNNFVWLVVRAGLGAYISFVVVVVMLQLLGTWRRLIADGHGDEAGTHSGTESDLLRFNDVQVYGHGLLALSILVLWVTGLPITFNEPLGWVFGILGSQNAITIHGIAGGLLTGTVIFYLVYGFLGIVTRETTLKYVFPGPKDLIDGIKHVKYLLGIDSAPPASKYTVLQKAECWIIAFESFVMIVTGLLLWSAISVTRSPEPLNTVMTQWAAPSMMILREVHAIVGVTMLAGITFHLFMTHIKEWPLDKSMFTGKVEIGRACEEWQRWAKEQRGVSDIPCEEYSWRPALTIGAMVATGVFVFVWLGAVLQYTLAPIPTCEMCIIADFRSAGLPGGWIGSLFSLGLNLAFVVVVLGLVALAWGFKIRWSGSTQ